MKNKENVQIHLVKKEVGRFEYYMRFLVFSFHKFCVRYASA